MTDLSDVAYATTQHRDWLERLVRRFRQVQEDRFAETVAHEVCRARRHPQAFRNGLRPHCRPCRVEVDQHLAVINNERLPL